MISMHEGQVGTETEQQDQAARQPRRSDAMPGRQANSSRVNVGNVERTASMVAGSLLTLVGLSRRSIPGVLVAGVGGALIYRGATGYCPAYDAAGIDTAGPETGGEEGAEAYFEGGIHIEQSFLINKPANELYAFWRNFENLPQIMPHLESVTRSGDRRSHWVARAQGMGKRLEWDAEVTTDEPDKRIAWQSVPGGDVDNAGEIRFTPAMGDRGTDVHVFIDYIPPAGRLGHLIASMLGQNPRRVVRENLRNFKRLMEMGEIPTLIGQPHGTCTGEGERYTESDWKPLFT